MTDHKALVSFLKSRVLNKRLHGWVLKLLDFDFEIIYRPGKNNQDADALSRQAWDSCDGDPCHAATVKEEKKQPRSTASLPWGDVGTAHIEKKDREREQKTLM